MTHETAEPDNASSGDGRVALSAEVQAKITEAARRISFGLMSDYEYVPEIAQEFSALVTEVLTAERERWEQELYLDQKAEEGKHDDD